ncbi:MAG: ArsC family reductase [Ferruginibacter sp.]
MIKLYGIPNCDTTKKAMTWLHKNKLAFSFHDYKTQGIEKTKLQGWIKTAGLEKIFNKKSTTWRELPESEQEKVNDPAAAIQIMLEHNSIIKRPILENGKQLIVGFNEKEYQTLTNPIK